MPGVLYRATLDGKEAVAPDVDGLGPGIRQDILQTMSEVLFGFDLQRVERALADRPIILAGFDVVVQCPVQRVSGSGNLRNVPPGADGQPAGVGSDIIYFQNRAGGYRALE